MLSLSTLKISTKLRRGLSVSTTLWKNKLTPKSNKPIDINDVEVSNLESAKLTPQQIKEITIVSPEERNIPNNLQPFYIPHLKFQIDQSQKNYETETNPIFKQVSKFRYNLLLFNYSNAEKNYKKYMRKEIERTNTAFFDPLSDKIVKLDPESGELVTVDQALHEAHLTVPPAFHNLPEESKLYVDSSDFYLKPVSTNINNQRLARATRILMFALPGLFNKMYFHQNSLLPRSSKIPDTFSLKIDKATNDFILVRSASKKINPELYAYDASGNMPLEASSDLAPAHPSKRVNFPAINQRPYGINLHGSFFNMGGAVGFVRVIQERRGRKPWVGPVWRVYDFWFPILAMSACIIYICLERDQWKEDDTYGVGPYLKRNPFKLIKDENVCCTDAMLEADGSNVKISPGQSEKLDPMARNSLTQAVQILINSDFLSGVKDWVNLVSFFWK